MPLNILVIEDDAMTLMLVESLIAEAGHVASTASDTDSARVAIEGQRFDAVLADWTVPGSLSTADIALLALALHPEVKFMFTSGHNPEYLDGIPEELKTVPFFQKPVDYAALIDSIDSR